MKKAIFSIMTAVMSLMAVTAMAEVSVHDPSIIKANGTYYIFGTHITAAKSEDLINWTSFTNGYTPVGNSLFGDLSENLAGSFAWAGENDMDSTNGFAVWAPDVFYNPDYVNDDGTKGAYLMYYSTSSTAIRSCIGLAVSKNIEGPYTYVDTLVYSGFTQNDAYDSGSRINKNYRNTNLGRLIDEGIVSGYNTSWGTGTSYNNSYAPNCIDPCIYEDAQGGLWMVYGSWSGGIFTLEIDRETGRAIYPGKDGTTSGGNPIDRYFGVRLAGGKTWSGEGPFIYYDKEAGYFYLQDTYEWLGEDGGYHIRLFRSKNPDGPFVDTMGHNALYGSSLDYQGLKLFGNYRFDEMTPAYKSGGHSSALIDDDGKQYLFYHTRFSECGGYFESRVHRMFVNEDGWPVVAPYRYLGDDDDKDSFTDDEIIGSYQYINHGSATGMGAKYEGSMTLFLDADGSVSGAARGKWSSNGKNITLTLTDGIYTGVLYRQKNENGEPVLTFTAAGNNNSSVWGVKNENKTIIPKLLQSVKLDGSLGDAVTVARPNNAAEVNPVEITKSVSYADGINGKALRMDGTYGLMLPELEPMSSYTVSLWIRPDRLSKFGPIVSATPDFVSGTWLNMTTVDPNYISRIWSRRADIDLWPWEDKAGIFTLNKWQHMIISVDANRNGAGANTVRGSLYIDGSRVSQGDVAIGILEKGGNIYIGANAWDPYFSGLVSDIKVFDTALTMEQAQTLYESSLPVNIEKSGDGNSIIVETGRRRSYDAVIIAAFYKDGVLVGTNSEKLLGEKYEFSVPEGEPDLVKIFIWDSLDRMRPLTASEELEL